MGIAQSDHSKSYTLYIKVPNPIVTFSNFPSNESLFQQLQQNIQQINSASSLLELPSDYSGILQKLFDFLENTQPIREMLKYSSADEFKNIESQFSQLETHLTALQDAFKALLREDGNREDVVADGNSACEQLARCFADKNGHFYRNFFITSPYIVVFAGIYKSFSKLFGGRGETDEMIGTTVEDYKIKAIQERLDNIKMLRSQSVS